MQTRTTKRWLALAALAGPSLFLAACSTPPPPTAEMRSARDAIARAEYDGAGQLASQPFQLAQDKLSKAQANVRSEDMDQARNLAEESQADADYADAVAVVAKSSQSAEQLQGAQRQLRRRLTTPQSSVQ